MTVWIIAAFFVGALFGGVVMSCLAASGKADKAEEQLFEKAKDRNIV